VGASARENAGTRTRENACSGEHDGKDYGCNGGKDYGCNGDDSGKTGDFRHEACRRQACGYSGVHETCSHGAGKR
jgi:hypothetical protein